MLNQIDYATELTYAAYGTAPPPEPKATIQPIPQVSPATKQALQQEVSALPGKIAIGAGVWFFLIYWFLIRK